MAFGFPVFVDLRDKLCVVLGEGAEADEKAELLRQQGAKVRRLARAFRAGDLDGAFLAIASQDHRPQNAALFQEAEARGVLLNCLDDPRHCRFIFPSVHRQGDLVVAVSTGGACPALAVRLRERFEQELGPEYAEFLVMARGLRERIARLTPEFAERKALWYRIADSGAIELLRQGKHTEAERLIEDLLPRQPLS